MFDAPPGVRFDHALFEGLQVTPHYDSMLGKLVVHAATRDAAIERLAAALDRTVLLGVPTNRRFLAACLRHAQFRAGEALIPFLQEHAQEVRAQLAAEESGIAGPAAASVLAPPAAALACRFPRPVRIRHRGQVLDVGAGDAPTVRSVRVDGSRWHLQHGTVDFFIDDVSFEPATRAGGAAAADDVRAPFNGKVIAVKAQPGTRVSRGDTLLVIESMKLEHSLAAARDGVVKAIHVQPGQQASTSQVLVTFEAGA
jgi:3-methylcrotonyl-CoA carboxylase alpha subunit/geranyl-CoA carboxylase alpha subunit